MMNVEYIVNSVFTSRTYILTNDAINECWLVDCGDVDKVVAQLPKGCKIKGVLLTHVHYDHIYGLPKLVTQFPEIEVITNEVGKSALANPKLNMSKYHGAPIIYKKDNVMVCKEGMKLDLFEGVYARLYETPGHHPSCLTFEIKDNLFTGDAYIPGVAVVTTLPGADKELARDSLERIMKIAKGKKLYPGHEVELT